MPNHELTLAAKVADHRRAIAGLFCSQSAPEFFSGILVKRHGGCAGATRNANEIIPIKNRMPGPAPHRSLYAIVCFEIMRPFQFAVGSGKAEKTTLSSQCINSITARQRRNPRAGWITHGVGTIVFILPDFFA